MDYSFNKDNTVSLRAVSIFGTFDLKLTLFIDREFLFCTFLCKLKMVFPFFFFSSKNFKYIVATISVYNAGFVRPASSLNLR